MWLFEFGVGGKDEVQVKELVGQGVTGVFGRCEIHNPEPWRLLHSSSPASSGTLGDRAATHFTCSCIFTASVIYCWIAARRTISGCFSKLARVICSREVGKARSFLCSLRSVKPTPTYQRIYTLFDCAHCGGGVRTVALALWIGCPQTRDLKRATTWSHEWS